MPLLFPNPKEGIDDFLVRFMFSSKMNTEYPDHKERLIVAYSTYQKYRKNKAIKKSGT